MKFYAYIFQLVKIGLFPASPFSLFSSFHQPTLIMVIIKFYPRLDSNHGPLIFGSDRSVKLATTTARVWTFYLLGKMYFCWFRILNGILHFLCGKTGLFFVHSNLTLKITPIGLILDYLAGVTRSCARDESHEVKNEYFRWM